MTYSETVQIKQQPSTFYRWAVLIFVSLAMFGNYYIYDSIAPIADLLKSQLGFTDTNIGSLNSIYSFAAVFILIVSGPIIDRIGVRLSILIFGTICSIAALITFLSSELYVMLGGRLLLGIGAEPLIVAITTALAKWFKGKELGFAFGINLTIARLGSFTADWSPTWASASYSNWNEPLFIAFLIGLTCLVGGIIYFGMDSYAEKNYQLGEASETDKFVFADLFKFDRSFWYIVILCVTFYSAVFPFRTFAIKFYMEVHGAERELAGQLNSSLIFASMIATPLFGLLADKIGKRASMMMLGSILILPVYLLLVYSGISLIIPIVMLGIAFSLIPAVMWPSVAYLVEQNKLGTAYSIMTLIQQLGVFAFNYLLGWANDTSSASAANPEGYALGMWILSGLGIVGFIFAYLLRKNELGPNGHGLEKGIGKL
ncbi:MAG: MFS transporter [Melioribacteraceae bacterium]|nr:MFS transporter [Melioribacteraceae bacterium]MCO6473694.1 MFS transporter [Melioribacteraceae bacterium]MDD3559203.1 MFS transporter [Melioribacteraceae bacterium]